MGMGWGAVDWSDPDLIQTLLRGRSTTDKPPTLAELLARRRAERAPTDVTAALPTTVASAEQQRLDEARQERLANLSPRTRALGFGLGLGKAALGVAEFPVQVGMAAAADLGPDALPAAAQAGMSAAARTATAQATTAARAAQAVGSRTLETANPLPMVEGLAKGVLERDPEVLGEVAGLAAPVVGGLARGAVAPPRAAVPRGLIAARLEAVRAARQARLDAPTTLDAPTYTRRGGTYEMGPLGFGEATPPPVRARPTPTVPQTLETPTILRRRPAGTPAILESLLNPVQNERGAIVRPPTPGGTPLAPEGPPAFYSRLQHAIDQAPFEKGLPAQWLALKGANQAEFTDTGLRAFLEAQPATTLLTRTQVREAMTPITTEEVRYGTAATGQPESQAPRWTEHTLPGGEHYREIVLRTPQPPSAEPSRADLANASIDASKRFYDHLRAEGVEQPASGNLGNRILQGSREDIGRALVAGLTPPGSDAIAGVPQELHAAAQQFYDAHHARETRPEPFTTSHWSDVEDPVAHLRLTDRYIGRTPTTFAEEFQSDVHQQGRSRGYRRPSAEMQALQDRAGAVGTDLANVHREVAERLSRLNGTPRLVEGEQVAPVTLEGEQVGVLTQAVPPSGAWRWEGAGGGFNTGMATFSGALKAVHDQLTGGRLHAALEEIRLNKPGTPLGTWATEAQSRLHSIERDLEAAERAARGAKSGVPKLPFAKTEDWLGLLLRRQLAEAVQSGHEQIAWTSGAQQALRSSEALQQHLDEVHWNRETGELRYYRDGHSVHVPDEVTRATTPEDLRHLVGRDVAERLEQTGKASGTDISVGADFFRLLYDQLAPRTIKEIGKKLGVKLWPRQVDYGPEPGEGLTTAEVIELATHQRGETRDFLRQVADQLSDGPVDQGDLENALNTVREEWIDAEADHLMQNWEPTAPDVSDFEEGARQYVEDEIGQPVQGLLDDWKRDLQQGDQPALPGLPAEPLPPTLEGLRALVDDQRRGSQEQRFLKAMVEDLESDFEDTAPIPWRTVDAAHETEVERLVQQQAEFDRANYEPEPMSDDDREALADQAAEYANRIHERAERALADLAPAPSGHQAKVWAVTIPHELRAKIQSGEAQYLYTGLDPRLAKGASAALGGAVVGGVVGAGSDKEHPIRGALVGAGLGALGGGLISRALRGRRGAVVEPTTMPPHFPMEPRPAARPGGLPVEPPITPSDFINPAKFDVDPSGKVRLEAETERVVQQLGLSPKKVVTRAELRETAAKLGVDFTEGNRPTSTRMSGAQMLAIRNVVSANVAQLEGVSHELARPDLTVPDRRALEHTLGAIEGQNAHLLDRFIRARSEAGRDLNSLKVVANRTLDPAYWWTKARQWKGADLTADEYVDIRRFGEARDRAGLVQYVSTLRKAGPGQQLLTLWKAGLLTNPKTHLVNLAGNTAFAALETAKDPVAALVDRLLQLRTGERTKGGITRLTMEASVHGAKAGLVEAWDILHGKPTAVTKLELRPDVSFNNIVLDTYVKTIFRLLEAGDRPYYQAALFRSLAEQATVAGKKMGLQGVKLREYVEGTQRGEGLLADQLTVQAISDAEVATFKDRTSLGKAAQSFARDVPGGQVILPFQRTPGAVATRVLEYSPLGLARGLKNAITVGLKGKGASPALQRAAAEQVARGLVGSGAVWLGAELARHDLMTGAAPTMGSKDRTLWLQEGRKANSLWFQGQWVNIGRVSPAGNLLALGANLYRAAQQPGANDLATQIINVGAGALKTVADQPFLTGASTALSAIQDPEREGPAFLRGLAGSVVPAAVGAVARASDVARVPQAGTGPASGVAGAVMERIPGLRTHLPPRITTLGDRIPAPGWVNALFNPATASPDLRASDPLIRELADAGYAVPRPPRQAHESPSVYTTRSRLYGVAARQVLEQTVQSADYHAAAAREQDALAQAAQLRRDPAFRQYDVERLRDAILAQLQHTNTDAVTRAEVLERAVSALRRQLKAALQ